MSVVLSNEFSLQNIHDIVWISIWNNCLLDVFKAKITVFNDGFLLVVLCSRFSATHECESWSAMWVGLRNIAVQRVNWLPLTWERDGPERSTAVPSVPIIWYWLLMCTWRLSWKSNVCETNTQSIECKMCFYFDGCVKLYCVTWVVIVFILS